MEKKWEKIKISEKERWLKKTFTKKKCSKLYLKWNVNSNLPFIGIYKLKIYYANKEKLWFSALKKKKNDEFKKKNEEKFEAIFLKQIKW